MQSQNFTPDFDHLRTLLTDLSQTSIHLIQRMNIFFANMSPDLMKFAAKQLREEWQQKCGKTNRYLFHHITRILNTLARQQVAFMDENFMQLAMGVNLHYGFKVIDIRKEKQYRLHCPYCLRYVSNHRGGRIYHMNACPNNFRYYKQKKRRVRRAQRIKRLKEEFAKQSIQYDEFPPAGNPSGDDGDYQPKTIMQKGIANLPTYTIGEKYQHSHQIQLKVHQYYIGSINFDFLSNDMVVIRQEDDNEVYDQAKMVGVKVQAGLFGIQQHYSQQDSQQGEMESERSNVMVKAEEDQDANIYQFNPHPDGAISHYLKGSNELDHNLPPANIEEALKHQERLKVEQPESRQHRNKYGTTPKIQNQIGVPQESNHKDKQKQATDQMKTENKPK